jgi:lipoate---protein ligase
LTQPAEQREAASQTDADVAVGSDAGSGSLFGVEEFRVLETRHALVRKVHHPTLVLGSTQRPEIVDSLRAAELGAEVVRRRGGGGAVLLRPGDHLWIDAWVPRGDPLWHADVGVAAAWVGRWWVAALASFGACECVVHEGSAVPGEHGSLVCFSGKGPGEVFHHDRKVMGVSQWRGKEGALFHTCAYTRWDPLPLVELLHLDGVSQEELLRSVAGAAAGLDELPLVEAAGIDRLGQVLLSSFPAWREGSS